MSDTLPQFKVGDRVRVMQVPEAESWGIANARGTIAAIEEKPGGYQRCTLRLDDGGLDYFVWNHSLMQLSEK